jgi:trk system potassium uptake protein TrkA
VRDHVYLIVKPDEIEQILTVSGKKNVNIKRIMILGGSRIGVRATKALCPDHSVKLIERDRNKCFELADQCPRALIINSDGRNVELLEEENIDDMDAFIALTGNAETNIMSCLVAKARGVKKTIALVENMDYIQISQTIGIDTLINKKLIAASRIFRYIREGQVIDLASLHGVNAEVLEYEVKAGSRITRSPIRDLDFPRDAILGGLIREGEVQSMRNLHVRGGDRVIVFALPKAIHKVEAFFK